MTRLLLEISIIAHLGDLVFARELPKGVTTAQYGVLNRLVRLRRRETISELARAFQVAQPTMSSTVAQLRKKGLVELQPSDEDRRRKIVAITAAGARIRADGVLTQVALAEKIGASLDEREWETILPQIHQMRLGLEQEVFGDTAV
ncbi:MAG: MarR family winged helix-turn-helix transcriptional regulator [Pseudomonadota bacterium]